MLIAKNNDSEFINLYVLKEDFFNCEKIFKDKNIIEVSGLIRKLNDFEKSLTSNFKTKMANLMLDNFNIVIDLKLEKLSLVFIIKNVDLPKYFIDNYYALFFNSFKKIAEEQIQQYNTKYIGSFNVEKINTISDKMITLEDVFSFLIISNKKNGITKNIECLNELFNLNLKNNNFLKNNFKEIINLIPFNNLNLLSLFFDDDFTVINKNGEKLDYKKYFILESISNLLWFNINSEFDSNTKFNLDKLENILTFLDDQYRKDVEEHIKSIGFTEKDKEIVEKCLLILKFTTINKTKKIVI